ncbi:MAG: GDSL-type esterase/lipase family protein [Verrucomicrobiota bacterium]
MKMAKSFGFGFWLLTLFVAQAQLHQEVFEEKTVRYTGGPYLNESFGYRLMRPAKEERGKSYPLVVFLHGAGERGTDNRRQLRYLPEKLATPEAREAYPCFLIAPQCRPEKKWVDAPWEAPQSLPMKRNPSDQLQVAIEAIRETVQGYPVDRQRIYLTGLSMGGYGAWELGMRFPEWFAALGPVCGGGDERVVHRLADLPIWTFHGGADPVVPVGRSRTLVERLKLLGRNPRYTEIKDGGHRAWDAAYGNGGMVPWLFEQKRPPGVSIGNLDALFSPSTPLKAGDRIVVLGDSLTQFADGPKGFLSLLRAGSRQRPDLSLDWINAGVSGNKVPDLMKRLQRDVLDRTPTVVVVFIGINDVWHHREGRGTSKAAFEVGLTDVITRLQSTPASLILVTPPLIGEKRTGNRMDSMLEAYASISRKVAAKAGITVCDLRQSMSAYLEVFNRGDAEKGILTSDGVHLSEAGNRMVANRMAGSLIEALQKRR